MTPMPMRFSDLPDCALDIILSYMLEELNGLENIRRVLFFMQFNMRAAAHLRTSLIIQHFLPESGFNDSIERPDPVAKMILRMIPKTFPNLTVLRLGGLLMAVDNESISVLSELTQLRELDLSNYLEGDEYPKGSFHWYSCRCPLTDISPLSALTQLRKLRLDGHSDLWNIDPILGLTKLLELSLEDCSLGQNGTDEPPEALLPCLSSLSQLRKLNVGDSQDRSMIYDLDDLALATELRSLSLQGCKNLTLIDGLSILVKLTELNMGGCGYYHGGVFCGPYIDNISVLSELTDLRKLDLSSQPLTDDCISEMKISGMTQLRELDLMNCFGITSVSAFSKLTELRKLSLFGNNVRDISPLTTLIRLRSLDLSFQLSNVGHLWNILELAKLTELRELSVEAINLNESHLSALTQLTRLNGPN